MKRIGKTKFLIAFLLSLFLISSIFSCVSIFNLLQLSEANGPSTAVTISSTSSVHGTMSSFDRKVFQASGLYWDFFDDGSNHVFMTSQTGATWSHRTTYISGTSMDESDIGGYYSSSNNTYYYCYATISNTIKWRYGTLNANSTITWGNSETTITVTASMTTHHCNIRPDSSGKVWLTFEDSSITPPTINVWNNRNSSSFGSAFSSTVEHQTSHDVCASLFNMGSGDMSLHYGTCYGGSEGGIIDYKTGIGWAANETMDGSSYYFEPDNGNGIVKNGVLYFTGEIGPSGSSYGFFQHEFGNNTVPKVHVLDTGFNDLNGALTWNGGNDLFTFYTDAISGTAVYFQNSTNMGATWSGRETLAGSETITQAQCLESFETVQNNSIGVVWKTSQNIKFDLYIPSQSYTTIVTSTATSTVSKTVTTTQIQTATTSVTIAGPTTTYTVPTTVSTTVMGPTVTSTTTATSIMWVAVAVGGVAAAMILGLVAAFRVRRQ